MKKIIVIFAVSLMIAGLTNKTMAQATVTGTTAGAQIIAPISLTQTSYLHFGTMAVSSSLSGTCLLSTANVRTAGGGVNLSGAVPLSQNAAYLVGGSPSVNYVITLPISITVIDGTGHTMLIDNLAAHPASEVGDQLTGVLSAGGSDNFSVGGRLTVSAGQNPGPYSGTFDVTVAYY